jgi:hypothetical protein
MIKEITGVGILMVTQKVKGTQGEKILHYNM